MSTNLRRVPLELIKPKNPPNDLTPVPASGATYAVYRQGALVRAGSPHGRAAYYREQFVVDTRHAAA